MKKTIDQLLQEGIEQIENGTFAIEIDSDEITVRDPQNVKKRLEALRRLNTLPQEKLKVRQALRGHINSSKASHGRVSKLAKRKRRPVDKPTSVDVAKY
jgi:hypothetical protein